MSSAFLEGETVSLTPVESDDLSFIRDGVNHPAVWRTVGGQALPTNLDTERAFYEEATHDDDVVTLLITVDGTRVGVIELSAIDWVRGVAEVSYWVHPDRQREGIASDALNTVVEYAFGDLRLRKLSAEVAVTNRASRRTVESAGFEQEGTLVAEDFVDGEPVDVIRYGLVAAER